MASKAISELESVSKIQDDDLLLLSMSNNSTFKTKKITGENLKSTLLSGVSVEQTVKEGTEVATIDINGKATPIFMPNVNKGDTIYPMDGEDSGTQIARIVPGDTTQNEYYLCAPTTSYSSNMDDNSVLLGTLIADGIPVDIRCPSGIGQGDVTESCKAAIDDRLEYISESDEVRIGSNKFKVHDVNTVKTGINESISFNQTTSILTIGDDSLKIPNIDSDELKDLMDESFQDNLDSIRKPVGEGILSSRSGIEDMVKNAITECSSRMQDNCERAIETKLSVDSDTNKYTVGSDTIYVSKLTSTDIHSVIASKFVLNPATSNLTINGASVHIPTLSEVGSGYPYIDSTKFTAALYYKGKLSGMTVNTAPTSLKSCSDDTEQEGNKLFKFIFTDNYYIKLNIHSTDSETPTFWGFMNSGNYRYEFGRLESGSSNYLTWEGYVKKGTIMYVSIDTESEDDTSSMYMYPVS